MKIKSLKNKIDTVQTATVIVCAAASSPATGNV